MRGPIVYCLEEADNGKDLHLISLPPDTAFDAQYEPDTLGGIVALYSGGLAEKQAGEQESPYREWSQPILQSRKLKWIPYYT